MHAYSTRSYSQFQISDGVGGNAQTQANAVFVDPFNNVDLTTVSSDVLEAMNNMREAAESAETDDFNPQIDDASGATGRSLIWCMIYWMLTKSFSAAALKVGKTQNKVLKLTGEVQALNIQLAQAKAAGKSTSSITSKIAEEQYVSSI